MFAIQLDLTHVAVLCIRTAASSNQVCKEAVALAVYELIASAQTVQANLLLC